MSRYKNVHLVSYKNAREIAEIMQRFRYDVDERHKQRRINEAIRTNGVNYMDMQYHALERKVTPNYMVFLTFMTVTFFTLFLVNR